MDQDLMQLSKDEQPKYKSDSDQLSIKFTIPVTRMYINNIAEVLENNHSNLGRKFKKYQEFFEFSQRIARGEDIEKVNKDYHVYLNSKNSEKVGAAKHSQSKEEKKTNQS